MWDGSWYDMIESYVNLNRILFKYITLCLLYWFAANLTFDGMWDIDQKSDIEFDIVYGILMLVR